MSQKNDPAGLPETVEYPPLPNIYRAFAAGASPYAILTETIDNSIDFVRRQALDGAKYPDSLEVSIEYVVEADENAAEKQDIGDYSATNHQTHGKIVITDNAGGVPPNQLAKFFQLGHTDAPPEGIGRFGVGAKRLIGIGDRIKYESHANGYQIAAGFEVDARDLESPDNTVSDNEVYSSEVYEVEDLDEGHTRIIVEDLNKNAWANLLGRNEEGEIDRSASDSLWRLGETYEHFLADGISVSAPTSSDDRQIDFDLEWSDPEHDVPVEAPEAIELSRLPFDGLHPRRYAHMPFANSDEVSIEEALRVDITVGLMPASDPENAGLTVTMNNRNVLFRDTDNDLFSSRFLGKFRESQGHGRLHCVIELYGPAEDMPWSDTKNGLDGTQDITDHLLNIAENALSEYRRQNYENLPKWILAAYGGQWLSRYDGDVLAEIPDGVEEIDKSGSKINSPRFNSKPGVSKRNKYYRLYPERDELIKTVRLHTELRIQSRESISKKALPAYDRYFEVEQADSSTEFVEVEDAPKIDEFEIPTDSDEPLVLIANLEDLAARHANEGRTLTEETKGVPDWILPRYHVLLENMGLSPDNATSIDQFDFLDWQAPPSSSEGPSDDTETDGANSIDGSQTSKATAAPATGTPTERDTITRSGRQTSNERQRRVEDFDKTDQVEFQRTFESGDTTGVDVASSDEQIPPASTSQPHLDESDLSELREALGMDDDATGDELLAATLEALEEREHLRESLQQLSEVVNLERLLDNPPELSDSKE
ncbi:ATP-binding protein [Salinigranum marinum]|uniref:ATP-binding protein n=1 Tax=Salinigranum marinum TaxID=1515595 RepID=UPI002989AAAE|nr:ATP-binding protein [Salinigranum marinum]